MVGEPIWQPLRWEHRVAEIAGVAGQRQDVMRLRRIICAKPELIPRQFAMLANRARRHPFGQGFNPKDVPAVARSAPIPTAVPIV